MIGNKLTKKELCTYIRKTGLFQEPYEDGWFFTNPTWLKDDEGCETIFRVKNKYIMIPEKITARYDGVINVERNTNNQIPYNMLPQKMLFELLDICFNEYKKEAEKAPLLYKLYLEKQKLENIKKDF